MTQPVLTANQSNFVFLNEYDPLFLQLAQSAERAFSADPNTTLIKLRQFAEAIAQEVAARSGVVFDEQTTQADLLYKLNRELGFDPSVREAVRKRQLLLELHPGSPAALGVNQVAVRLLGRA